MANDKSTLDENAAITEKLQSVNGAAQDFMKLTPIAGDALSSQIHAEAKQDLITKTIALLHTIRGPVDMVFANFEEMSRIGALRALYEAGVFQAIPKGGKSATADEISAKTGMDKSILIRLMRSLTPMGPFAEVGEETYAHTPFSEIYMNTQLGAVFEMMVDEFMIPMARNWEFLKTHSFKNAYTITHNPFTLAHDCEGDSMFGRISKFPYRLTRFNEAMVAQDSGQVTIGIYPFEEQLSPLAGDGDATVVDIGGGRGHVLRQIKESTPNLKGKFILQDRAVVIEDNKKFMEESGIEAMAHDFFEPQPVKGALVYYLRRIFHDWPDEPDGRKILENIASAMDPKRSRILITEFIVPEVGSSMLPAWMDHTMLVFGGMERTEKNFAHLLDISGLRLVKVWRAPGTPVGVVEAVLK